MKAVCSLTKPRPSLCGHAVLCLLSTVLAYLYLYSPAAMAQIGFNRYSSGPVIPAAGGNSSWHGYYAANPSAIVFNNTVFLYARGIATVGANSTLGVWAFPVSGFDGVTWNQSPTTNPILQGTAGEFDSTGIMDPSAVVFNGQVFLYYGGYANGSDIGLATSPDGLAFTKQGVVLSGGGTPFAAVNQSNSELYLFYTQSAPTGGWEYYVATSTDGIHFGAGQLVFGPSQAADAFDQTSIITIRVWYEAPYYYMTYGGSPTCPDYPEGIGLARSTDLINWTRYPNNPILLRGPAGGWDEAALWSGTLLKVNGLYYMWYEAAGSNAGAESANSNSARNSCYGGYGSTSWSQVGLATAASSMSLADWTPENDIVPSSEYALAAQSSSMCLGVPGDSTASGTALDQETCTTNWNQLWEFTSANDGFYNLSNDNSGTAGNEVLDVPGSSVLNNAAVDQAPLVAGGPNQEWLLVPTAAGIYQVINRNSGNSLTVLSNATASGAAVVQSPWSGAKNQEWELTVGGSVPSAAATVNVSATPSTITTAQGTSVTVSVSGGNATPAGTATLSGGGMASISQELSGGESIFTVPSGAIAQTGQVVLIASYSGDGNYTGGTGAVTLTVNPVAGNNFILNPNLEENGAGSLQYWTVSNTKGTNDAYVEDTGHNGAAYRMTMYYNGPTETTAYQNISVPNATYTLSAWVVGGGVQSAAYLYASNYGGTQLSTNVIPLETGWGNWEQATIANIVVTTGTITVGAYSSNPSPTSNDWVSWSDFSLVENAGAPTVPAAPVAAAATSITSTGFTANWAASSGATGYFLDVATDSGFTSFVTGYNNLNVGNVTGYAVTGLKAGTTYYYQMRASNAAGTSADSNAITAATTAAPAASFTLTGSAAQTVAAGNLAAYTITVTPNPAPFSDAVMLSCSSGLPTGASCAFNPTSVTPGSSNATSALTISTTSRTAANNALMPKPFSGSPASQLAGWFGGGMLALVGLVPFRNKRNWNKVVLMGLFMLFSLGFWTGCGGSASTTTTNNPNGTPAGSYAVTIAGVGNGVTETTTVSLTVQ